MTTLRLGTRGSDLALWQSRWVIDRLRKRHPSLTIQEVIIKTHGDEARDQRFDQDWPVGGFVGAIEQALSEKKIDFAVHSYKDLPSAETPGLVIAAVPGRELVHDVLVTRDAFDLSSLPPGFRIGTSSPRRSAQFRMHADVEIVPIRGNVATRIAKIETEGLDGVVLAAAGLKRLGIEVDHRIDLPTDRFIPTPSQGALAIQTRLHGETERLIAAIDEPTAHSGVRAERAFLRRVGAGCQVAIGALSCVEKSDISLHGQLFSEDGERVAEGHGNGTDPEVIGASLADRLIQELGGSL